MGRNRHMEMSAALFKKISPLSPVVVALAGGGRPRVGDEMTLSGHGPFPHSLSRVGAARRPNPVHVFASVVHRRRAGRTAAPARASVPGAGGMRAEPAPAWDRTATDRLEAGAPRPMRKQPQAPFPALVHRVNQP